MTTSLSCTRPAWTVIGQLYYYIYYTHKLHMQKWPVWLAVICVRAPAEFFFLDVECPYLKVWTVGWRSWMSVSGRSPPAHRKQPDTSLRDSLPDNTNRRKDKIGVVTKRPESFPRAWSTEKTTTYAVFNMLPLIGRKKWVKWSMTPVEACAYLLSG